MYNVDFVPSAAREHKKLPADARKVITRVLGGALALDPFSRALNTKKLEQPLSGYRLRIGDYRVLYTVDTKRKQIVVYRVRHRKDAYK